uniref:Dimer_Tnp_hAT domain-containing protein n=1 Tax=Heterorhabditis bacteriophora TaxID=37862 RepID=A0A1I7WBH8_HETBA
MKDDIKEQIISITSDGWSSSNGKISIYRYVEIMYATVGSSGNHDESGGRPFSPLVRLASSYIYVTAHYINHNFERKNAVLAAVPANEMKHTSTNISKVIEDTIREFNLTLSDVGAYIHDSAANMRLSAKLLGVERYVGYVSLYKNEKYLCYSFDKILFIFSFNFVYLQSCFIDFKNERNYPVRQIPQDIPTRWNSLYFSMVEILKQLPVINKYASVYQPKANLPMLKKFNDMEKELLKQVVHILSTFQKHSTEVSVPNIFQFFGIPICFINFIVNPLQICKYDLSMVLENLFLQALKTILTESEWDASEFSLVNWHINKYLKQGKPLKRPVRITSPDSTRMYQERQIEIVKNIRVQISNSPLIFWKANSMKFPILSKWARIYLGCPPTSVSSERLFSRAGLIFNNKLRTRISGARGEKCLLIFL